MNEDETKALDFLLKLIKDARDKGLVCTLDPRNSEMPTGWDSDEGGMAFTWKNVVIVCHRNPRSMRESMHAAKPANGQEWKIKCAISCHYPKGQNPKAPGDSCTMPFLVVSQMINSKGQSFIKKFTPDGIRDGDVQDFILPDEEAFKVLMSELILDDDNIKYYMCSKYPLYDDEGKIIGTWGSSKDVTEQKNLEKELQISYSKMELLTRVDDLSGLYNRRYLYEELEKYASMYVDREDNSTFSIIVLDLDDMKFFNDQNGQQNGDLLLRYVADILLTNTRKADTCFRTGGDEFAVVLPDTDKLSAMAVAKNIIRQISGEPFVIENKRLSISGSAGVAAFNKNDPDITDILSKAERKLNKSKREGKNQVSV